MKKSEVIFENESYKLLLSVGDIVNDYHQYVYRAELHLHTLDGLPVGGCNYGTSTLVEKCPSLDLMYDYYLDHLQARHVTADLAFDLYLSAFRSGHPAALNM
jgi:hypothetical protein